MQSSLPIVSRNVREAQRRESESKKLIFGYSFIDAVSSRSPLIIISRNTLHRVGFFCSKYS